MKKLVWIFPLLVALAAYADTGYVTDRLSVALKSAQGEAGTVVKLLEAGAPLEVLERAGAWARVRDKAGAEGWVDARQVTAEAPARAQLARLQDELTRAKAQLAETQAQLKKAEAAAAQATARAGELAKKPNEKPAAAEAKPPAGPAPESETADAPDFSWGWLVFSFAMLGAGFWAGIVWLRERNRRKLGGMYLRI